MIDLNQALLYFKDSNDLETLSNLMATGNIIPIIIWYRIEVWITLK